MTSTTPADNKPKKMPWLKRIAIVLLVTLVGIQFVQPDKNNTDMVMANDISTVVTVPDSVHTLLKTACYDCHSNQTNYPWYTNIQPVGWWLADHIEEGKSHLNFQTFATLKPKPGGRFKTVAALQDHKLEEVRESQADKWMPLESYSFIHGDAKLTDAQRQMIINWVDSARVQLAKL